MQMSTLESVELRNTVQGYIRDKKIIFMAYRSNICVQSHEGVLQKAYCVFPNAVRSTTVGKLFPYYSHVPLGGRLGADSAYGSMRASFTRLGVEPSLDQGNTCGNTFEEVVEGTEPEDIVQDSCEDGEGAERASEGHKAQPEAKKQVESCRENVHDVCKIWIANNINSISFVTAACPRCNTLTMGHSVKGGIAAIEATVPGTRYRADVLIKVDEKTLVSIEVAHTHLTAAKKISECEETGTIVYEVQTTEIKRAILAQTLFSSSILRTTCQKSVLCTACDAAKEI
jgi:hypothetical protein